MKIKITYDVSGKQFDAWAFSIAEAYEYIKVIIEKEKISFPNTSETLSEYMKLLAKFEDYAEHHNHIFSIQRIPKECECE